MTCGIPNDYNTPFVKVRTGISLRRSPVVFAVANTKRIAQRQFITHMRI
jgi:hypothetical protein